MIARTSDAASAVSAGSDPGTYLDALLARRNVDGGWGANLGSISNSECTALSCLAVRGFAAAGSDDVLEGGTEWLISGQDAAGAWSYSEQVPTAPWATPLVLLALSGSAAGESASRKGFAWLLEVRGRNLGWRTRLRQMLSGDAVAELDDRLEGWPWVPGTFSWVEPTAWALVALKNRWPADPPRRVRARIREAEDMLIDRACVGGGWNYGNSVVLGEELPPYPDTTAIALLGLRGRADSSVEDGLRVLDALLDAHASPLSLALAILSRRAWNRDVAPLRRRLTAVLKDGMPRDTRSLALSVLAFAPRLPWLEGPVRA